MITILSEETATLVEKGQLDGTHCFQFSPATVSSGISDTGGHQCRQVGIRLGYASGVCLYRQPTVLYRS